MPSAFSERYQSRLFNFVHKQSRRWSEGVGRTFRHLQVAASWSLEALVYPVFMLVQKARESAGKQLHTSRQPTQNPQLQANYTDFQPEAPPVADIPIQRVLKVVESLSINPSHSQTRHGASLHYSSHSTLREGAQSASTPPHLSPNIRGIASQLCDRQLVLVSSKNEILDILTPQQKHKLEDRIITEIANYWHQWRLSQYKEEKKLVGEINCLLTKLTGSHGENKTPALPFGNTEQNTEELSLLNAKRSLALLDAIVAKLESNALEPISHTSRELIQALQTQLQIFIYGKEQIVASKQTTTTLKNLENPTSKIQNLIWAALNFFFRDHQSKKLNQSISTNKLSPVLPITQNKKQCYTHHKLLKTSKLKSEELVDLWLNESDVFGDVQVISKSIHHPNNTKKIISNSPISHSALPSSQTANNPLHNLIHRLRSFTLQPQGRLVQKQNLVTNLTSTQTISVAAKTSFSISQQQHYQTAEMEAKPEWIETKAKIIGYEKHPLEQILAWLDGAMLWLEEMIVRIFQLLQRLWRGK
ncbi:MULTISPECIES: hypothetical protein [Fischerella]|uniref:Uncharacterized protein n=1 Tax=Fischerella muscicola CCMEE 5323 TaxID=2019572 RepID=A0A2N6JY18_FISMU|nr:MULTISPECIES: hypothetical protein [Fischerella]MBD2431668.1 hypothetical protein [Fischerella sp. FACHB-380]PLZ85504.1 hypothetical protein CEN44_22285 [Fischerella muscicola CCMEE 5323]